MGLLAKKSCSICGEKAGLMSNTKLSNGNICKKCRSRLSPYFLREWYSKDTSVEEIREQLAYREENYRRLAQFHPATVLGENEKLRIDYNMGVFAMATGKEIQQENVDLIPFFAIRNIRLNINEEDVVDNINDERSKSHYEYYFALQVEVEHPWFDIVVLGVSPNGVMTGRKRIYEDEMAKIYAGEVGMKTGILESLTGPSGSAKEKYLKYYAQGQEMVRCLESARSMAAADRQP